VLDRVEKLLRIARQPLGFHAPLPPPPPPPQPQPQYFAKWQEQQEQLQQQAATFVCPYRPPAVPFASVQSPTGSLASYANMPTPAPLRVPLSEQRRFAHVAAVPAAAASSSQQQQQQQQYELHDISELTHSRADESSSSSRPRQSSSQQQPSPHMDLSEAQLQHERFLLWQQRLHGGGGSGVPAPGSSSEQGSSSLPWQQHSDGVSAALANSLRNIQELRDSIRIGGGNTAASLLPRTLNHTPPVHQAASEAYTYPAVPPAVHPFLPPPGPASGADDGLVNLHFTLPPSSSTNVLVGGPAVAPSARF
jgi:hypothetical protein